MSDINSVGWYVAGLVGAGLVGVVWAVWAMSKRTIHVEQHNIQHNEPHVATAPTGGGLGIAPVLIKWAAIALLAGFALVAVGNMVINVGNSVSAGLNRLGDNISRAVSAPAAQPPVVAPQPIVPQPVATARPAAESIAASDDPQAWQYVVLAIVLVMCVVMMVAVLLMARRTQPSRLERAAAQLPPLSYTGRIIDRHDIPQPVTRATVDADRVWEEALEKVEL